ncbi:MAG: hypothetical protein U1A05_03955 [Alphaproteobacteria bacterium]|nr:hypothetical protein [Alphaproteobacteria bacterium]
MKNIVHTLRRICSGCARLRDSRIVTYLNTLIGITLGRLPGNLKLFEYILIYL